MEPRGDKLRDEDENPALRRQQDIDRALAKKEWSLNEWARQAGVDRSTVYRYYKGHTRPQPRNLAKMLNVLDLTEAERRALEVTRVPNDIQATRVPSPGTQP